MALLINTKIVRGPSLRDIELALFGVKMYQDMKYPVVGFELESTPWQIGWIKDDLVEVTIEDVQRTDSYWKISGKMIDDDLEPIFTFTAEYSAQYRKGSIQLSLDVYEPGMSAGEIFSYFKAKNNNCSLSDSFAFLYWLAENKNYSLLDYEWVIFHILGDRRAKYLLGL